MKVEGKKYIETFGTRLLLFSTVPINKSSKLKFRSYQGNGIAPGRLRGE